MSKIYSYPRLTIAEVAGALSERTISSSSVGVDLRVVVKEIFGHRAVVFQPLTAEEASRVEGGEEPKGVIAASTPMDRQVAGNHYKGDKIQHFTLCKEDNIPWGESSAIKYLMRHRKKNGLQDLLKALHYVEMTIEHYHPGALAAERGGSKPTSV